MRITFLSRRDLAHPLAGGSEILIDKLAAGLVTAGHQVTLLCAGPVAPRTYEVVSAGGTYSHYPAIPLQFLRHRHQADLVVDVVNAVPYFSPLWRRRPTLCFVNHIHTEEWGLWFPPPLAAVGRRLETWSLPAVYRRPLVVAISPSTALAVARLGVPREHIRVLSVGVDVPLQRGSDAPEPLFLALGRLVPQKRLDLLLRLWERVRPITGGQLVIAGTGPENERLKGLAGPGVTMVGRVDEEEKRRLLESAWLLVHPASAEGWGLVVMEAAAAGTPTIAFDVPGVRDSVADGHTGILAHSPDEFVQQWVRLACDAPARNRLGTAAAERAQAWPWSATISQFAALAHEAVAWGRGPAVGLKSPGPGVVPPVAVITGDSDRK